MSKTNDVPVPIAAVLVLLWVVILGPIAAELIVEWWSP